MMKSQVTGTAYMNMPVLSDNDDSSSFSNHNSKNKTFANYITFNQDGSCIALGVDSGYRIYSCVPKISKCLASKKQESVGIVEMLFRTSLLVIVGTGEETGSSPRKLKILNTKRQTTLCDLIFPSTILSVKLSHHRLVVLLEEQIYIYDITTMNLLHTIETSPNSAGVCTLTSNRCDQNASLLAYPSPPKTITHESLLVNGVSSNGGSNSAQNNIQSVSNAPNRVGDAIIFDLDSLQPLAVIEAHKSALSAMCFSSDGSLLATASDKGTIVRVFNVQSGLKLFQFRRGTYPTKIYDLSFSKNNRYVIATSASETVHIFRLGDEELLANKQKHSSRSKAKQRVGSQDYQIIHEEPESDPSLKESIDKDFGNRVISEFDNECREDDEGDDNLLEDDGDDSDAERDIDENDKIGEDGDSDDNMLGVPSKHRKLSQGSSHSFTSVASGISNNSASEDSKEKAEPIIDQNRLSVARIIRRSSQNLGRKAAQKMGDFLPSRFSSILEPTRHFASLKIQSMSKDVKSIATLDDSIDVDDIKSINSLNMESPYVEASTHSQVTDPMHKSLLHINVVTSEGYFYTYGLDAERGGDCILLNQYSLLDD